MNKVNVTAKYVITEDDAADPERGFGDSTGVNWITKFAKSDTLPPLLSSGILTFPTGVKTVIVRYTRPTRIDIHDGTVTTVNLKLQVNGDGKGTAILPVGGIVSITLTNLDPDDADEYDVVALA